ncbi:hypothetical protein Pmani_000515 [Petrolisthes manimaculis]|uniref:Zinc-hook domain-containing protein n=1 Tax=Petrolisthes manimaculis TaxID=1843537 RepID=A0AAE1USX3_9EUCA|nr:hypothetical protein Pmani_000515 [Petrolisthes manimaculis]
MSRIEKMSIQGIRSFGPDDQRKINFFSPLTLILGQNGCGKTTIIESLRYISTGDMPPGANRSFVHEPRLAGEMTVRGQIKLLFRNTRGEELVSSRSLEATQKAKRVECKTLDATMCKRGPDGKPVTLSSKCSDFEILMTTSLGVAKPILNNVIFCHQEDSNWPLDEGKKVKEKFDAIFSATKYIRCLDTMKKQRAEMKTKVKNMKEFLSEIKKWKDEANRKRADLQKTKEQEASCKEEKEKLTNDLRPIIEKLKKIAAEEDDLAKINGEINGKQHQLKSLKDSQAELRESLSEQVTCSDTELNSMIQDFKQNLARRETELKRVESEVRDTERRMEKKQREVEVSQRQQGALNAAHIAHKNHIQKRNTKIFMIVEEHTFTDFQNIQDFSDDNADIVLSLLVNLKEEENQKTINAKNAYEKDEGMLQSEIDKLRAEEAALEQEIKIKSNQADETKRKIKATKHSLLQNENDLNAANLEDIEANLSEIERKIEEEEKNHNTQRMSDDINSAKKKKLDIEHSLRDIKHVVSKMNKQAEDRSKYDIHLKEKKDLENRVELLKRKNAEELEHLLSEIPKENIKNKLDACSSNIRTQISTTRSEIEKLNKKKTQLDITIKGHKNQIDIKENEIKDLKRRIDDICQGSDLDSSLEKSKDLKEKLTRERGDLSSSITVLKRFTDKLKQEDCCPLCHRNFSTKEDVLQLIEELEGKVSSVPGKLEIVKRKLAEEERTHEQIIQLKPQQNQANKAQVELDKIRSQMETDISESQKVGSELDAKKEFLDVSTTDEDMARQIQSDVVIIENNLRKIRILKDQVDELQATLGSTDGGMNMEEATARQNELDEDHKRASDHVEELQEQLQQYKDRLQRLRDRKFKLSTDLLNLKTKQQETEKLKDELTELEGTRSKLEEEKETAQENIAPYKYKIRQKTEEKSKITKTKEAYIVTCNSKVNEIHEKHRSLKELHNNILSYMRSGGEKQLLDSQNHVAELQEEIASLQSKKKNFEEQSKQAEKDISRQKERKRNLDDEKKIREKEVEAKKLQQVIAKLQENAAEFKIDTLVDEKSNLNETAVKMQHKRATLSGRMEEIEGTIRSLESDLKRKEIRDAEKNYKEKYIEMKCVDIASDDLNKYYKALDTAIMRFHMDKMKTINGIIRELWRSTYKGNDIDYIEIKTDETESAGADKRRLYNYRVVMVKNDTEMDMRGRCSAGQKVLASLLIRMALAETFSSNCGILALDEPTTNLDRENIDALSMALVNIVNTRRVQKNLQLIVITHDREFLEKMTHADFIDYYYEVTRDERGLSVITPRNANQM